MTFADIRGNEDVCRALRGMVDSAKIPHAIMFHEDDGGGAFPMTLAFLDYLYGGNPRIGKLIHPDLHFVFPTSAGSISDQYLEEFRELALDNPVFTENQMSAALGIEGKTSMIAVSEARHLLDCLSLSALEGGYRSVVIYLPEKMNQEASNRLLKLIEEPPQLTQFVLITHAPEKVLLTIASRCQRIRIVPGQTVSAEGNAEVAELFSELMTSLVGRDLVAALETGDRIASLPSRESVKIFCKFAAGQLRKIFLVQQSLGTLAGQTEDVERWASACGKTFPRKALEFFGKTSGLVDRNVNIRIVIGDLVNRLYMSI